MKTWVQIIQHNTEANRDPLSNAALYSEENGKILESTPKIVIIRLSTVCQFAEGRNQLRIKSEEL